MDDNELLAKIHKVVLYILLSFDKICRENNLTYFLDSGTALGAVRHGGFIPWDDDVDVGMPRKDYERFLQIAQEKLPEDLFLQTHETDPAYWRNAAKIRLKGTIFQDYENSPYAQNGFFIDIFPFDNVSRNQILARFHVAISRPILYVISLWRDYGNNFSGFRRILVYIIKKIPCRIINYINNKHVEFCRRYEKNNTGYLISYYWKTTIHKTYIFKESELFPVKEILFEGHPMKIMKNPDYYLKIMYGNYMQLPPENKRHGHLADKIDLGNYL